MTGMSYGSSMAVRYLLKVVSIRAPTTVPLSYNESPSRLFVTTATRRGSIRRCYEHLCSQSHVNMRSFMFSFCVDRAVLIPPDGSVSISHNGCVLAQSQSQSYPPLHAAPAPLP